MTTCLEDVAVRLSVIIPTYNRCALLSRTLPTLFQQTCPAEMYEIIVVVDGSVDGTADVLHRLHPPCKLHIVEQSNRGQAAARNAGLKMAAGELILFLDDDLLCDPKVVIEHMVAHSSGENQVIIGPVYVSPDSHSSLAARRTQLETDSWIDRYRQGQLHMPLDAFVGANTSVRRETILAVGGFDEKLVGALEDVDLGLRLWHAGVQFRFQQDAITHQIYLKSNGDLVHVDGPAYGRNQVVFSRKHPRARGYLEFGLLAESSLVKRTLKKWAVRQPALFERPLSLPCWLAERFPGSRSMERIGLRALSFRRNVAMLRSAVDEAGGWSAFESMFGVRLPALLFHNIGSRQSGTEPTLTISPEQFEKQIRWLKRRGYSGIRCLDWLLWLCGEKELPKKPVILTFDDAYVGLAEYALPALKEHGFLATVFVVTDQIGGSNAWDEKVGSATLHCMTAGQIQEWAEQGFEFAAHTRTHADLRGLSDADRMDEVEGSAQTLSDILGTQVSSFAYPYGYYSDAVKKQVGKVFDLAFTCDDGINVVGTDPHLLRRTMVRPNDTLVDLVFYLRQGSTPINHLRDLWHRVRPSNRSRRRWGTAELSRE